MTALEALKARYDAGEEMTDLETLVLTYGGETEAVELARTHDNYTFLIDYILTSIERNGIEAVQEWRQALDSENRKGI
jgi:hypothetical protein